MAVVMQHSLQAYGTGDELAGALTQYSNYIVEGFYDKLILSRHIMSMPITNGSTYQFPASAFASGTDVVPGVLRSGANQPEMAFRTVSLDPQEFESDRYTALTTEFITHFPTTAIYGRAHGQACAETVEDRLFRALVIGARQAAISSGADLFRGGTYIQSATTTSTTSIATNYPRSLTGSLSLQADIERLGETMTTSNVPTDNRVIFLSPYLVNVLRQDKTLLSADYQAVNDMTAHSLLMVNGFHVEETTRLPAASDLTNALYPASYRVATTGGSGGTSGGLHGTVDSYYTVALAVGAPDSVGQITALGGVRPVNPVWYDNMNAWFLGAKVWQGAKWIRPEACGEIALS
jgi:hypothetical protein